jgi:hypothetical protein
MFFCDFRKFQDARQKKGVARHDRPLISDVSVIKHRLLCQSPTFANRAKALFIGISGKQA